jgi:hypothetical protein
LFPGRGKQANHHRSLNVPPTLTFWHHGKSCRTWSSNSAETWKTYVSGWKLWTEEETESRRCSPFSSTQCNHKALHQAPWCPRFQSSSQLPQKMMHRRNATSPTSTCQHDYRCLGYYYSWYIPSLSIFGYKFYRIPQLSIFGEPVSPHGAVQTKTVIFYLKDSLAAHKLRHEQ